MRKTYSMLTSHGIAIAFLITSVFLLGAQPISFAQDATQKPDTTGGVQQLGFLLGKWIGEGGGAAPGQGTGGFEFSNYLNNRIMVRENYAEYPATADKPAYRHDDLMTIYQQPGDTMRAIYFDNEGHVINYVVELPKDGKAAIFTSAPSPQGPRFRLTHALTSDSTMTIKFEMAPPGQPQAFTQYITATAHKK